MPFKKKKAKPAIPMRFNRCVPVVECVFINDEFIVDQQRLSHRYIEYRVDTPRYKNIADKPNGLQECGKEI